MYNGFVKKYSVPVGIILVCLALLAVLSPKLTDLINPPQNGVRLNRPFKIGLHQKLGLAGTNLAVEFAEVVEDSRCPRGVVCVWEGTSIIKLNVYDNGDLDSIELEYDSKTVYGYSFRFVGLKPYPGSPEDQGTDEDYVATIVVRRQN